MKNEYLKIAECYENLAKSYRSLAETDNENTAPWEDEQPVQKEEPADDTSTEEKNASEKVLTLEEVRVVLAEKSRSGHTAEVKALLTKYGADKLSEIDSTRYNALLKDAEAIGNE